MLPLLLLALLPTQTPTEPSLSPEKKQLVIEATVRTQHRATQGQGSGVVVCYEAGIAYILTAAHCVPAGPGGDVVDVTFYVAENPPRLKTKIEGATVKARMLNEDIAVLALPMAEQPPVISLPGKVDLRSERFPYSALTIGCVGNSGPEVIADRVTARKVVAKPDGTKSIFWEAEKPQHVGRSGGPLVNGEGQVVGICSGTQGGKGYYSYSQTILRALEDNGFRFLFSQGASNKPPNQKNP